MLGNQVFILPKSCHKKRNKGSLFSPDCLTPCSDLYSKGGSHTEKRRERTSAKQVKKEGFRAPRLSHSIAL